MPERKKLLLRLDPAVYEAVAKWAADDLRSVNAQIEYGLRLALRQAGRDTRREVRDGTGEGAAEGASAGAGRSAGESTEPDVPES
ncbi:hypothetical protein IMZ11_36925 [Microtetraspora sp. AC03309]|uniref:hypothetical protein n=1 Tax=Microtetraspora sp. AC03309 TaxID=2779376 RepID=UPI001E4A03EB|nr:hypothetical protein [Microtetraspora sp. AC03309]MCC5581206.1 hypothetical protein [Microtetraspora sp. AC03309]